MIAALPAGSVCFVRDRDKEMFHVFHQSVLYMWSFFPYSVTCFKQLGRIYSSVAHEHILLPRGLINSVSTSENNYALTLSCVSANCMGKKPCLRLPKSVQDLAQLWGKEGCIMLKQQTCSRGYCLTCLFNPISFSIPDPPGVRIWPISRLVGSGCSHVRNDGWATPLWSWQWRWSLWIHPSWWCLVSSLAQ